MCSAALYIFPRKLIPFGPKASPQAVLIKDTIAPSSAVTKPREFDPSNSPINMTGLCLMLA